MLNQGEHPVLKTRCLIPLVGHVDITVYIRLVAAHLVHWISGTVNSRDQPHLIVSTTTMQEFRVDQTVAPP